MEEVIEKYFRADRIFYFSPEDLIAANHFLRYRWQGDRIILSVGSDEGEVEISATTDPAKLESIIKSIII